jgi:hypothetical protein
MPDARNLRLRGASGRPLPSATYRVLRVRKRGGTSPTPFFDAHVLSTVDATWNVVACGATVDSLVPSARNQTQPRYCLWVRFSVLRTYRNRTIRHDALRHNVHFPLPFTVTYEGVN